jgi:hypothetical protein
VALNGFAPAGGAVVTLTSDTAGVSVPASVTVAAGTKVSPTFTITTSAVTVSTPVTISATFNGVTQTTTLTVVPVQLSGISLYPTSVVGGSSITGMNTITLNGPAGSGGITVALSSNDPSSSVPASVTVVAGSSSVGFIITTKTVTVNAAVTISASYGGVTKTATLTVLPPR